MTEQTKTEATPPRPSGWIVTCPACGHTWSVTKEQIHAGGWQICPACVDQKSGKVPA